MRTLYRVSEADRLHPRQDAAGAFDNELHAAFRAYPTGTGLDRVLTCARNLHRVGLAPHLNDEHLRQLWRERGTP
mgnify:CR=1 FL=1